MKGCIIVFTVSPGSSIRSDLKGCRAKIINNFQPGEEVRVVILDGRLEGRELSGNLSERDFIVWAKNKGK